MFKFVRILVLFVRVHFQLLACLMFMQKKYIEIDKDIIGTRTRTHTHYTS
jgi:hypothetical protein